MMWSGILLTITFIGIFTEGIHGIHRTKIAMLGAGVMIMMGQVVGFYDSELAKEAVDWNVVFLLGGMMTIVAIMIPTGGFQYLAYRIADICKGRLFFMMAMMGTLVTALSLLLDNVTTVVIFGPLIILICQSLKITPIPYLLAAALFIGYGWRGNASWRSAEFDDWIGSRYRFQYLRLPYGRIGIRGLDCRSGFPEGSVQERACGNSCG